MQNKPNSPIVQTNLNFFITMIYVNLIGLTKVKNKPNQTQYKPNQTHSNPTTERPKMNIRNAVTMNYKISPRLPGHKNKPNQTQTNPIFVSLAPFIVYNCHSIFRI